MIRFHYFHDRIRYALSLIQLNILEKAKFKALEISQLVSLISVFLGQVNDR